jgi:hypothetical protein
VRRPRDPSWMRIESSRSAICCPTSVDEGRKVEAVVACLRYDTNRARDKLLSESGLEPIALRQDVRNKNTVTLGPVADSATGMSSGSAARSFDRQPSPRGAKIPICKRCWRRIGLRHRFIPAGAGNTMTTLGVSSRWTVHPRRRGEHIPAVNQVLLSLGSSLQALGTPETTARCRCSHRFIPAGAGNSGRRVRTGVCTPGASSQHGGRSWRACTCVRCGQLARP